MLHLILTVPVAHQFNRQIPGAPAKKTLQLPQSVIPVLLLRLYAHHFEYPEIYAEEHFCPLVWLPATLITITPAAFWPLDCRAVFIKMDCAAPYCFQSTGLLSLC
ncbi:hypothetical protein [Superficieibacter sp.]|uniref:hypothetical protein n=1 Tax=Superficieibacter sp. TaxID=2303322 RepID=UPI0028B146B4|nr:hypothetical protein [Superficieibacter sp.]